MKLLLSAVIGALSLAPAGGDAQDLVAANTTADAAKVILAAPNDRVRLIETAGGLGVADPVELVFALITPATAAADSEAIAHALTLAAPRRADEVAASTALAAAITDEQGRLVGLIAALMSALAASPLDEATRSEEAKEVLAALLSVTDPRLRKALADAVSSGNGAALLAALGEGPETAAIIPPPRPFGDPPAGLILTPASAAQDAPSAN